MKFNESWLREWVHVDCTTDELVHTLTMSGLEVDEVSEATPAFSDIIVARIESVKPHPEADKLNLCQVNTGDETLQIVCGARNVRPGLCAPFARVGAVMPGGQVIKAAELRGIASEGMLCSATEIGLVETVRGLMELPDDAPPGVSIREYLSLDDTCIEVDLTPNRADCFCIRGIARDVAAATGRRMSEQIHSDVPAIIDDQVELSITATEACPRYLGRVIRGVNLDATSPLWMQERLRRCGLRSISPIVDVTNYVMLELGQPMHAFDRDKIRGTIGVRWAREGESLKLLDDSEVSCNEKLLLITDDDAPSALAGIMGGLESAITDDTRNIFLEVAYFDPASIIGRARDLGMHTDASHRFERGVDPWLQQQAMARATALLLEIVGGEAGPVTEAVSDDDLPVNPQVTLTRHHLDRLLGVDVETDRVTSVLENLGMDVLSGDDSWRVTAPSARFDIHLEVDLIEEVARMVGYDKLPAEPPSGLLTRLDITEAEIEPSRLKSSLVDRGYFEAINYSFIDPAQLDWMADDSAHLPLANALSADYSVMRTSLIPGLLATARYNQRRQQSGLKFFESGMCVISQDDDWTEVQRLAALICGQAEPDNLHRDHRDVDFFDIKGDLEAVLALSGLEVQFMASSRSYLHPWQSAEVMHNGASIGWVGALHPKWMTECGMKGRAFGFEIDDTAVRKTVLPSFRPLSVYPSVRRDLSIVMAENVKWLDISQLIEKKSDNLLTNLVVFDEYKGPGIEKDKRSLAIGVILQDRSGTLKDEQVDAVIDQIVEALKTELNVELRG